MNTDTDIVCAGDIMIECFLHIPSLPQQNTTLVLDSVRQELGGPAFNLCWYLSQYGRQPRLVGPFGLRNRSLVVEALSSAHLDDSGLIPIEGDTDLLITMLTDYNHHSIYLRSHLPDAINSEILTRCGQPKRLILSGSRHPALRRTFLLLADMFQGEMLAFNPSYAIYEYDSTELAALLRKANVAIVNEQEAEHVLRVMDLKDYGQLSRFVPGFLIVTLGKKGVRVFQKEGILEIGSFATGTSNAVGAGDAFFAGFLHEMFGNGSLADAARFGSALAAYVVESSQIRVRISEQQVRQRLIKS